MTKQDSDATTPILEVKNLKTYFPIRKGLLARTVAYVKAVDGVSLQIDKGESLGLVGESGCGKSTLGRTIIGLEATKAGAIFFKGQQINDLPSSKLRSIRKHIQIIFQDPYSSLNPRMTIRDILAEGMIEHRLISKKAIETTVKQLMADVGLDAKAIDRYPHEFSGGQRQRINIARAVSLHPQFIVCDEAVSALDISVQAQVINLLEALREKYHLAYLFISHDLSVVRHISDRIAVMYLGKLVECGETKAIMDNPQHPYTIALISAVPVPLRKKKQRIILKGEVPSPVNPPKGCRFHTRCPFVKEICKEQAPELRSVSSRDNVKRLVACHFVGDLHV